MSYSYVVLTLTLLYYWAESSPTHLGTLEFDNLDADIDSLSYEVEEEDLDDYTKLLEANNKDSAENNPSNENSRRGFKKKNSASKGSSKKHNTQDIKKLFKTAAAHDQGDYNDEDAYEIAESVAGKAVGIKGKEDRTYRKGTKTRGFHRVHHKDEYKKDKIFYEDDETKGVINKIGAKGQGYLLGAGVGFNKGSFHNDRHKGVYGKRGYSDKGFSDKDFKSNSEQRGFESYFDNE